MSTYAELVDSAILESGADLDPIDPGDFADPTKSMQRRFKQWVSKAFYEIQMESNNWEFKSKQAQIIIRPRVLVVDGDRATPPPAGSTYQGDDTGTTFEVVDVVTLDGGFATGDAVAYLEFSDLVGEIKWNELYDELTPTPANLDVFRAKWFGRYSLQDEIADLLEPNLMGFYIQSTGGSATQTNTADTDNGLIAYVPWAQWLLAFEGDPARGRPICFTCTPDGQYDFHPRPDQEYVLTLNYSAEPQELTLFNDSPEGIPVQYQDIIVWRAIMYWADFSESPSQFLRANRRYETIKNRLERNQKPGWSFQPNLFNLDTRW